MTNRCCSNRVISSGSAFLAQYFDVELLNGAPTDIRRLRSARNHSSWLSSFASLQLLASKTTVGLPSTSIVKMRDVGVLIATTTPQARERCWELWCFVPRPNGTGDIADRPLPVEPLQPRINGRGCAFQFGSNVDDQASGLHHFAKPFFLAGCPSSRRCSGCAHADQHAINHPGEGDGFLCNSQDRDAWHEGCSFIRMSMLSDIEQVLLFLLISAALGACFIWAFWELEQAGQRRRLKRKKQSLRPKG